MVSDIPSDNKQSVSQQAAHKLSLESSQKTPPPAEKLSNAKAIVESSSRAKETATAQKAQYEATLTFNRQNGSKATAPQPSQTTAPPPQTSTPSTQLTPEIIQRINQGLLTQVKVTTSFPLNNGDRILLNTSGTNSTGTGPIQLELTQIQRPQSPQRIQQIITNLVRALVPTQNSYSPLLSNLLALASDTARTQGTLNTLPVAVQQAIKQITQQLPNTQTLKDAESIKHAFKNSGIFLESNVKTKSNGALPTALAGVNHSGIKHSAATAGNDSLQTSAKEALIKNPLPLGQGTKSIPGNTIAKQNQPQGPAADFKHQLLSLEKTLSSAVNHSLNKSTSPLASRVSLPPQVIAHTQHNHAIPTPKNIDGHKVPGQENNKHNASQPNDVKDQPTAKIQRQDNQNKSSEKQPPASAAKMSELAKTVDSTPLLTRRPPVNQPTSAPLTTASSHTGGIHAYQSTPSHTHPSLSGLPPLPGQVTIQAQPSVSASIKGNEAADALVKILLKQTQESINRLQLHQLSTASRHGEENVQFFQPPLSFDLPILHFGQLTLFHFHIEEEPQNKDDNKDQSLDKKWHVSMGFDIEGLGAMFCELSLVNTQVYVRFWANEGSTVSKAKNHFSLLTENLQEIGVTVKELECVEGMPPQQDSHLRSTLIDIET